jgi:hypothetical protein
MKASTYLRIASVLTLVHAVMHTIGGVFGAPPPGPASVAAAAMKANEFYVLGHVRSYWVFYRGMGLGITISLTMETVAFWVLASMAKRDAARLRPLFLVFLVGYLAFAVNSQVYFFFGPVVGEILIAACMGMAWITAKPPAALLEAGQTATAI